jgi:hypothetical protein
MIAVDPFSQFQFQFPISNEFPSHRININRNNNRRYLEGTTDTHLPLTFDLVGRELNLNYIKYKTTIKRSYICKYRKEKGSPNSIFVNSSSGCW